MYFESHAHYDDSRYDIDREAVFEQIKQAGVHTVINVGESMRTSRLSIELAEKYDFVYAAVGVHPHNAEKMLTRDFDELRIMAKHDKVVAIGEIGLDFYYDNSPRYVQELRFIDQLGLCRETDLPAIIHSRDADGLTFDIIKESGVRKGVIHCYGGSPELAAEYVKLGFYIGVGGIVTYKNARKLVETTRNIPIESILIETDCPYLSPEPKRGLRNMSGFLPFIVDRISEIKQITHDETAKITSENARSLFGVN